VKNFSLLRGWTSVSGIVLSTAALMFAYLTPDAAAARAYLVDPEASAIDGSIHYALVGTYAAAFKEFSGTIFFDPNNLAESRVELIVEVESLESNQPGLDRVVKSPRLLHATRWPQARFQSLSIHPREHGEPGEYEVVGNFQLAGVTRELTLPFEVVLGPDRSVLEASGRWLIRRKDFGIFWNKILDHGGFIVGDHIVLKWKIVGK